MSKEDKGLAKSLHTVSVLVNLARYVMTQDSVFPSEAIAIAADILGYAASPDPYGLKALALKQLEKAAK